MGLFKFGSVVILLDNQISKDTDFYRLYNAMRRLLNRRSVKVKTKYLSIEVEND